jgi:hypothetical protein
MRGLCFGTCQQASWLPRNGGNYLDTALNEVYYNNTLHIVWSSWPK